MIRGDQPVNVDAQLRKAWAQLKPHADVPFPRWLKVAQNFRGQGVDDVEKAVAEEMARPAVAERFRPGMRVAIGVGSRGVANIALVVRSVVRVLRDMGTEPFVVPAMGSHGGATADGQKDFLAGLGVTEDFIGAPIRSSMEVVSLGNLSSGVPAFFDRIAYQADAVVPINRVKAHTSFRGSVESGLQKMLAIGFGKQQGAAAWHSEPFEAFGSLLEEAGRFLINRLNVPCGIALVENAREQTAIVEAVLGEDIPMREPELLQRAKELTGRFLVPRFDVLIIDQLGKDISGTGADPNVTGRYSVPGLEGGAEIQRVVALDLTDATQGSAMGMGLMDVVSKRVIAKADFGATWINVVTSRGFASGKMPIVMETDKQSIGLALNTLNRVSSLKAHLVRIEDTMHLEEIWISEPMWEAYRGEGIFEQRGPIEPIPFDKEGNLVRSIAS